MKALFISQDYDNIHESNIHYVCQVNTEEEQLKLIELIRRYENFHYIEFETMEDANDYFDLYELNLYKEYTRIIINQGLPSYVPENYRHVFVYMDDTVVLEPGFYVVRLDNYIRLSNKIRLPSMEELNNITTVCKDIHYI
jgi:hypothetical protein